MGTSVRIAGVLVMAAALLGTLPMPVSGSEAVGQCEKEFLASSFEPITSISDVDPAVLRVVTSRFRSGELALADVGEAFQRTDVVVFRRLPSRRLMVAGKTTGHWFVAYEHGGRGYHHALVVVSVERDGPRICYFARGWADPNLEALKNAVRQGKLKPDDVDSEYY